MKKILPIIFILMTVGILAAHAHHPAADVVDSEIYAIIDAMVSETPHADLTFDSMVFDDDTGTGSGTMVIDSRSVSEVEALVDDGLLTEASLFEGGVTVEMVIEENGNVQTTITLE